MSNTLLWLWHGVHFSFTLYGWFSVLGTHLWSQKMEAWFFMQEEPTCVDLGKVHSLEALPEERDGKLVLNTLLGCQKSELTWQHTIIIVTIIDCYCPKWHKIYQSWRTCISLLPIFMPSFQSNLDVSNVRRRVISTKSLSRSFQMYCFQRAAMPGCHNQNNMESCIALNPVCLVIAWAFIGNSACYPLVDEIVCIPMDLSIDQSVVISVHILYLHIFLFSFQNPGEINIWRGECACFHFYTWDIRDCLTMSTCCYCFCIRK